MVNLLTRFTFCIGSMSTLRLFIAYDNVGPYRKWKFLNKILPFDGHFKEVELSRNKN